MPDEHIHPTATGLAKKVVDAHQDPQDLVFWSGWVCHCLCHLQGGCKLTGLFGMVVLPLQSSLSVSAVKSIINLIAITVAYLDCS